MQLKLLSVMEDTIIRMSVHSNGVKVNIKWIFCKLIQNKTFWKRLRPVRYSIRRTGFSHYLIVTVTVELSESFSVGSKLFLFSSLTSICTELLPSLSGKFFFLTFFGRLPVCCRSFLCFTTLLSCSTISSRFESYCNCLVFEIQLLSYFFT